MRPLYILRNKHSNRIIEVRINPNKFMIIGVDEIITKRYYPVEELNNAYRRYKRRIGRILRSPNSNQ